jgi:hypothetical protein
MSISSHNVFSSLEIQLLRGCDKGPPARRVYEVLVIRFVAIAMIQEKLDVIRCVIVPAVAGLVKHRRPIFASTAKVAVPMIQLGTASQP